MIRINLANALMRSMDAGAKASAPTAPSGSPADTKALKDNIIKGVLILLPVIALMIYEKTNLNTKQQILDSVTQEKQALDQKLQQVGSVDDVIRQIEQQKQEVDRKVGVVRKIFSMRKQKINAIQALQTHIPRTSWINTVEFSGDELKITGTASTTEDAQSFALLLSQEKDLFSQLTNKGVTKIELSTKGDNKVEAFKFDYLGKIKE